MFNPFNLFRPRPAKPTTMAPVTQLRNRIANGSGTASGYMSHLRDIESYKKGGTVKKTGLAYLHKGEKVVPKSAKEKALRHKKEYHYKGDDKLVSYKESK